MFVELSHSDRVSTLCIWTCRRVSVHESKRPDQMSFRRKNVLTVAFLVMNFALNDSAFVASPTVYRLCEQLMDVYTSMVRIASSRTESTLWFCLRIFEELVQHSLALKGEE